LERRIYIMRKNIAITKDKTGNIKINAAIKKLLALVIALVMAAGALPFAALASDEEVDFDALERARINLFLVADYENVEDKLATFGLRDPETGEPSGLPVLTKDGMQLFYHYDTGEVAIRELATGQVMTSNPWDATFAGSAAVRAQLLSQIILNYSDDSARNYTWDSFTQAALNRQIKMRKIRGGIRVEYTIGRAQKRMLVPRMIERESFETRILEPIQEFGSNMAYTRMKAYYTLKDANDPNLTDRARRELTVTYPQTRDMAIYIFDPYASPRELRLIEGYIREWTEYTFQMMDDDHSRVNWVARDIAPPLFKMALEYYIDEEGLYMRLPANGIRFDESNYTLVDIRVLPFMGAIRRPLPGSDDEGNTGYTFVPDGSGALIRSEDIMMDAYIFRNRVYGQDYSFHNIGGGTHARDLRMPVFGAVESFDVVRTNEAVPYEVLRYFDRSGIEHPGGYSEWVEVGIEGFIFNEDGHRVLTTTYEMQEQFFDMHGIPRSTPVVETRFNYFDRFGNPADGPYDREPRTDGFLAIIEEGDVMAQIESNHPGTLHKFNSVHAIFIPRPVDSFNLNVETSGISSLITLASRRKYTGNYIIRYIMLSSDKDGNPNKPGGYEASYVGMAKAYRDFLIDREMLIPMTESDQGDIPLFIETLGMIRTSEYFFGIPYQGRTPLTTFGDIKTMIDQLNAEGIHNINFRLNGWLNGGLKPTAPARIRIENSLGGASGFRDMVAHANARGANIFPNMDYALVWRWMPFDGTDRKKDGARHMDQMYAREQKYCFSCMEVENFMTYAVIAPERMMNMYENSMRDFRRLQSGGAADNALGVSVSSLARTLNSNHNRRSLVNRMEARDFTADLLGRIRDEHGMILADQANAFAFKYVDAIVNVDLDSSRFNNQSESIPFYAMVTQGSISIAGSPINMSGDPQYDILKAIESGASPYFILSFQNSGRVKESRLHRDYYSINYTTWEPELVETYKTLNDALSSVKTKKIINHELMGIRGETRRVTYECGTVFILNYNHHDEITVDGHTIEPLGFVKIY
jgi:hypothetical protein